MLDFGAYVALSPRRSPSPFTGSGFPAAITSPIEVRLVTVSFDLLFLVSDFSAEETLYSQEHVSDKSQAAVPDSCAGDVSQSPKLGGLCDEVLGRHWNVSGGESLVQLCWEGDGTPVTMFLKGPLGEKDLICNGFDKNFSLSPRPLVCQGISAEERPHPHYTPET